MKNPLIKRLPRELKGEIGKYIVLFLFITMMIGIVSGFLVAAGSMSVAYDESFEKYNIESGNFELLQKADDDAIKKIEDGEEKIKVYENFYLDKETKEVDSTIRLFKNRKDIDKICIMDGELPSADDEIAIDRMYADNNKLKVGDSLTVGGKKLKITGLVALSDYSALYSNPSDMMFDALKFGVAIVTDTLFDDYGEADLHYSYSWKYDKTPADDEEAQDMAEKVMKHINGISMLTQFIPEYSNQAIHFTGDDIEGDNTMITVFLYLVMVIIAFVFAITTGNTIAKEANVIGTLRASGYTKGELVRHYLATPMIVVLVSAIVGNILGYTCFKEFAVKAYYGSYSLPTYKTIWNADAFIKTTVVPLIILFVINLVMLVNKLSLSPLKFLRRDLKKRQKKKAFKLNTRIGILKRFRLRVIFQNIPNYITVFVGILFANVIIFFGLGMKPMLLHYQDIIEDNMISKYQYVLKMPAETKTEGTVFFSDFKQDDCFTFLRSCPRYYPYDKTIEALEIVYETLHKRQSGEDTSRSPVTLVWDEYIANILAVQGTDKKKADNIMRKVSEILMLGRSLGVRLIISCQRPDAAAFPSGSRLNYGVILIVGAPIRSIYEMLIPKEYIDEIGDRAFKRGEGVALLQGSELRFIKIPMIRDMEKMQKVCIDALTREESPVEGSGEAACPQTVG